ncbi:MAG: type II secretion system protein N, partial [Pseudomonadota bacterium]
MKLVVYTLLGLIIVLAISVMTVPLGLVVGQLGLGGLGVGWAHTEGTLHRGRINGIFTQQQIIGDVGLELKPLTLLGGGLGYAIDIGGAGMRGTADVTLRPGKLELSDLRARQSIAAMEGLAAPIRAMGGEVRITDGSAVFGREGCERLDANVVSDALTRAAGQYGKVFGPVAGTL